MYDLNDILLDIRTCFAFLAAFGKFHIFTFGLSMQSVKYEGKKLIALESKLLEKIQIALSLTCAAYDICTRYFSYDPNLRKNGKTPAERARG